MAVSDFYPAQQPSPSRLSALRARLPIAALLTLSIRVAAAALAYGLQIVLARLLGESSYGVFSIVWVYVMLGGYLGCLGLSQSAVRFMPIYADTGDDNRQRGFLRFSLAAVAAFSVMVMAIAMVGILIAESRGWLSADYRNAALLAAACLPFFAMQDLLEGLARAEGRMLAAFVPPFILRALLLMALTVAFIAFGLPATATTAMAAAFLATLIACLVQAVVVLRPLLRRLGRTGANSYETAPWLRATIPLFLTDGAMFLRQYADLLLLAIYLDAASVGIYFALTRITNLLGMIDYAVGAMMGPRFARAHGQNDQLGARHLLDESVTLIFWPTLIGAVILAMLAPWLLVLFGTAFKGAAYLVPLLLLGPVLRALAGSSEEMLGMSGHGAAPLRAHLLALVAVCAGIALWVPDHGLPGAALAACFAMALNGFVLALNARIVTGHWPRPWMTKKATP